MSIGKTKSNIRKQIGFLQVYPLITSLVFIIVDILDMVGISAYQYLSSLFGTSLFVLVYMYILSRRLFISNWSKLLYVVLIVMMCVEFVDSMFCFSERFVVFNQIMTIMLMVGTISSFITYLYGRFKKSDKYKGRK